MIFLKHSTLLVARESAEKADDEDRSALRMALQKIEKAAADRDIEAYYSAIFEFAAVGLKAARNPLLEAIMLDLWPNNRRIQFASLSRRAKELPTNVRFFQDIYQCVIDGNRPGWKMSSKPMRAMRRHLP
jgi:DNA-binding GntR family transcriptional regulator